ncbi:hypothetical protein [Pseudomonas syringae]|uniref:hypothetical protein n=1 Tax=Pseudomonas syringae TaxID=317 RepID=UPI001F324DC2|nr:hypothetical protein [Pseudomonas syringae]MCF5725684.1 hypothetical protein [Pseudomonas syringae]
MVEPKISAQAQRKIEILLTKWKGKLTWDALVTRVELELAIKTTRQTLCTYVGIATSYKNKKAQLRGASPSLYTKITASDIKLVEQMENLRAEVEVLRKNNAEQLRMIERMLLNASTIPNLDLHALVKLRPEEIQKN